MVLLALLVAALPIDLSTGALSESNCKQGSCAHVAVKLSPAEFVSADTATDLAQHVLTLAVPLPEDGPKHRYVSLQYEFRNPTGQQNDVLCVSVVTRHVERECISGLAGDGVLTVPFKGRSAKLYLQFGTMPLSQGNFFAVRDAQLFDGKPPKPVKPSGPLDPRTAQPRQPLCATPIGCRQAIDVSETSLSITTVEGKPGGKLTFELPVPEDLEVKRPYAVAFDY